MSASLRIRDVCQQPLACLLFVLVAFCSTHVAAKRHPPVRMFILAGEANVEGFASISHLKSLAKADAASYSHLYNGTSFVERDDVYVSYGHHRADDWKHGSLSPNFGGDQASFGPELQMGHVLGDLYKEPVVIIKVGWKGRSLGKDFASPSTGTTGFQWYRMMTHIEKTANNLDQILGPEYKYTRPDFGGLIWWHGYTDFADPKMTLAYANNLEMFINDIRESLKQPLMPVVVAELGGEGIFGASAEETKFRKMQEDVVGTRFFNYSTQFVPTASYVQPDGPKIKEDHMLYYGNADTMLAISQACAMAIAKMDYTKGGPSDYDWIVNDADISTEGLRTITEMGTGIILLMASMGVFVFVCIMCYGGNMSRTWNTAMDRLRPSDDVDAALKQESTAVNMEEC